MRSDQGYVVGFIFVRKNICFTEHFQPSLRMMMMGPGGGMPGGQGGGPPKKTKNAGFLRRIYEDEFQVRTFFQILPQHTPLFRVI